MISTQRPEFNLNISRGGIINKEYSILEYDVTCERLLVLSPDINHGGIIQKPLNFRGIFSNDYSWSF